MDLQLYARVLWRFRTLIGGGVLLAFSLAFFSYVDVKLDGLKPSFTYRQSEQWESAATVGISPNTFLPGWAVPPEALAFLEPPAATPEEAKRRAEEANAGDFSTLPRLNEAALQLMRLATSDGVLAIMRTDGGGPIRGSLQTFPVTSGDSLVPYITFSAVAATPEEATAHAARHVEAFKKYVKEQQDAAKLDAEKRIVIDTVNQAQPAALLEGRKKTRPVIVFLAVMTAVIGLVFVLENLRPRVRPLTPQLAGEGDEEPLRRRSA